MPADAIRLIDGKTEFAFRTQPPPGSLWPPLEGVVRPAALREVRTHDARLRELRARGADAEGAVLDAQAAFYAAHLVSWNVAAPVTAEAVAQLPVDLFRELDAVVAGQSGLILGNSAATSTS